MGRELQKKKNRSSISKVRHKPKSKRVNPLGNAIIAANWNQSETLSQNYRRLGLASRLNAPTGGTEKLASKTSTLHKLAIKNVTPTTITPTEARVQRDPETGKITGVLHDHKTRSKANPLNDPLLTDSDSEEVEESGTAQNDIIRQLEEQASLVPEKTKRSQSAGEKEWIERLVNKWGDNTKGMMKDRKLNPMQQTEADIMRRVRIWREDGGNVS